MARRGLHYVPVVISRDGRVHPDSAVVLERLANQAGRRLGVSDSRPLLRRAERALAVAVWRRAAAMVRACLPGLSSESLQLLFGDGDGDSGG